jgi:putative ABC transport system substrate-binding protein
MDIRFKFLAFTLPLLLAAPGVFSDPNDKIAVIYPDIREPYLSVFEEIKSGIDQSLNTPAKTIIINKEITAAALDEKLDNGNIDAVITLGTGAYQFARGIASERIVISGAVFTRPGQDGNIIPSISMIASPQQQFIMLKEIAPDIKTIYVIYNPEKDNWLIDLATDSLKDTDTVLHAIPAGGLKNTAQAYQKLLSDNKLKNTDALWLLQGDKVSNENTILSEILQKAWEQNFVVFSANPAHVKRGALFATYPNNIELGKRLGNTIINTQRNDNSHTQPLKDLRIAFNTRTAEHLKLNISRSKKKSFDLIFPNR